MTRGVGLIGACRPWSVAQWPLKGCLVMLVNLWSVDPGSKLKGLKGLSKVGLLISK